MKSLSETLERLKKLKGELKSITAISEEAFLVFSNNILLASIAEAYEKSWKELQKWNSRGHSGILEIQSNQTIIDTFYAVLDAKINRTEFSDSLSETRKGVEDYIKYLQTEISKAVVDLHEIYDDFASNCGDFSFIFQSARIKELIVGKLLLHS